MSWLKDPVARSYKTANDCRAMRRDVLGAKCAKNACNALTVYKSEIEDVGFNASLPSALGTFVRNVLKRAWKSKVEQRWLFHHGRMCL